MTDNKVLYYHGSNRLFKSFSLDYAGMATGVKFGYGIYLTPRYETAAHYAKPRKTEAVSSFYVYTVAVPAITSSNCLDLNPENRLDHLLIEKVSRHLGEPLPQEALASAKALRKYVGAVMAWRSGSSNAKRPTVRQMTSNSNIETEKAASKFFQEIGIDYYKWPVDWKHPEKETNIAVLNPKMTRIIKVESVALDKKYYLIEGTQQEIEIL